MQNVPSDHLELSDDDKKPYHTPTLKSFGDIRELTLANAPGFGLDGPGGSYSANFGGDGIS